MLRRQTYIENRRVLADSGEITLDINVTDPITALHIEVRATNGATDNIANTLAQCIDTFQIVDGSDVLVSLSGRELLTYAISKLRTVPYQLISELGGNVQNLYAPILFGRWFGDQQFAFAPSRHKNPQIRFKWNLANVTAVGATGFVSGSGLLTVWADVMEGAPDPSGILTAKRHYSFTTAASGIEYVSLPIDQTIKAILIRSFKAATGGLSGISNLKLHGDNSKVVFFDQRASDFLRFLTPLSYPLVYKHIFHAANGNTIYPILKQDETMNLSPESTDSVAAYSNYGIGEGAVTLFTAGAADANKRNLAAIVSGFLPFNTAYKELGDYDDPTTWLDPSSFKSLMLELTESVVSADASIVLEQARVY